MSFQLTTPVAFIIFNRPDTTARVFAEIARAKPTKLLVIGDGPRSDRVDDFEKVLACRKIIESVDWDCEVLTNYSETNLGCKRCVSSGIDWVFAEVEEAIILEDDCLPHPSFFQYCQNLLALYRDEPKVTMINGTSFLFGTYQPKESYYYSSLPHIWGWASWREKWQTHYDVEMRKWPEVQSGKWLQEVVGEKHIAKKYRKAFSDTHRGHIDTWDYKLTFTNWLAGNLAVAPAVNLILNIGCNRPDATHTINLTMDAEIPIHEMKFPLVRPEKIVRNTKADMSELRHKHPRPILRKLRRAIHGVRQFFSSQRQ